MIIKQPIQNQRNTSKFALLCAGILLLITSCKKDLEKDKNTDLKQEAKDWYGQLNRKQANYLTSKNGTLKGIKQEISWDQAQVFKLKNGTEMISAVLKTELINGKILKGTFNLLITKTGGDFQSTIIYDQHSAPNINQSTAEIWFETAFTKLQNISLNTKKNSAFVINNTTIELKNSGKTMLRDVGSGGGGGDGPCVIDYYWTVYAIDSDGTPLYIISETYMFSMPCDDNGVSGDVPDFPQDPKPPKPCDNAKKLGQDNNFKNNFNSLKDNFNSGLEKGFTFNSSGYSSFSGQTSSLEISGNSLIGGFIHNHTSDPTHYGSFGIDDLAVIYALFRDGNMENKDTFVAGVTTPSGSYILLINDQNEFSNWGNTNVNTTNQIVTLGNSFQSAYNLYLMMYQQNTAKASEMALLTALANSGLQLFKGDSALGNWEQLTKAGTNVTSSPCN